LLKKFFFNIFVLNLRL